LKGQPLVKISDFKIVALYGSPRRGGNTDELLNSFLSGVGDNDKLGKDPKINMIIDRIMVSETGISPCRECRHCSTDGQCIVNDGMQKIYQKIIDCDLLIVGSPIFFTSVSGQLKSFIDRFQRFWALKYELGNKLDVKPGRKGILFSCAGSKPQSIFDCTKKIIRAFFDVIYIEYYADFLYNNIDFKGDVQKSPGLLQEVYNFAKNNSF